MYLDTKYDNLLIATYPTVFDLIRRISWNKLRNIGGLNMLSKERTAEIVKKYGKNEKDTGSVEVQIALLTAQINDLTAHLKANKKDASGRRGLFVLVGKRRGLLDYLKKNDFDGYVRLISELKIRK